MNRKIFWCTIFGISMGYFEASIVVYLREIFYPDGFTFPMAPLNGNEWLLVVEIFREFFSIVMLVSVAALIDAKYYIRFSFFAFLFGVWDIVYYIILKITLGWPVSLAEWDVLFLIPVPWIGPVWAPCLVSLSLIAGALWMIKMHDRGIYYSIKSIDWVVMILFGLIVIVSFIWEYRVAIDLTVPEFFPWHIFIVGEGSAVLYFIYVLYARKQTDKNTARHR